MRVRAYALPARSCARVGMGDPESSEENMSTDIHPHVARGGSARDREIVAARVVITCPGRNFVTLVIETRGGVRGLGDATLNGRELAVASYLRDHVVPNLIGRDAGRIEDTWQFF